MSWDDGFEWCALLGGRSADLWAGLWSLLGWFWLVLADVVELRRQIFVGLGFFARLLGHRNVARMAHWLRRIFSTHFPFLSTFTAARQHQMLDRLATESLQSLQSLQGLVVVVSSEVPVA